jgi:Xaa-Pro aminopeptidase
MSISSRLEKLRRGLKDRGIDAVLVSQPENRRYLSGFDGSAGWLLITEKKAVLATDFRYLEQVKRQAPDYELFRTGGGIGDWLSGFTGDAGVKKLGFEAADITYSLYQTITKALGKKTGLVPLSDFVEALRAVKEPGEIELIKKAAAIGDAAYEHVRGTIRPGMTEQEVAWALEKYLRESGSQAMPFEIIVAAGPNATLPHARPSDRPIEDGEPVVIDMGAKFDGYASDLTRTVCAGKPDDKFKKIYGIVLAAQQAAIARVAGGMTGHEADAAAREVIAAAGYGEAFGHGLGHGIGLATHEGPRLGPGAAGKLVSNMVFTIEPGIYLPGWGGVRIEDDVVLNDGKPEVITKARKESYG